VRNACEAPREKFRHGGEGGGGGATPPPPPPPPPPRDRALTGVMVALGILINIFFKILFI